MLTKLSTAVEFGLLQTTALQLVATLRSVFAFASQIAVNTSQFANQYALLPTCVAWLRTLIYIVVAMPSYLSAS